MKKRKIFSVVIIGMLVSLVSGCFNDDITTPEDVLAEDIAAVDQAQLQKDIDFIDAYLAEKGITAMQHPTGLRYVIEEQGSGETPGLKDGVAVTYRGYFMEGDEDEFDSREDPIGFVLDNVIIGWKIGIPLFNEGGKGSLYIPSVYAYGSRGNSSIPPNTSLAFDVELIEVVKVQ